MLLGLSPDEWTAIGTVSTAVVALFAALYARGQVREARRTREDQVRPFVVVDVQRSEAASHALNLVVENVGRTVAYDVRLTFEPPLQSTLDGQGYPLGDSTLVRDGLPTMPPGRRIQALFDVSHQRHETDLPTRYDVTVELKDARGKAQEPQRYVIDLSPLYGLSWVEEYGIHDAAKALRDMAKSMKKWSDIHGRLRVWVRDEDAKNLNAEAETFWTGRHPTLGTKPPPDLLLALGRSALVKTVVGLLGPLHRWIQRRLVRQ